MNQKETDAGHDNQNSDSDKGKINVLVMGISGSGKSTLINAVLGEKKAETGDGVAITKKLGLYENDKTPFRLIDTPGLEYDFFHQMKIRNELARWSKDSVQQQDDRRLIHMIWFCVDAQGKRVPKQILDSLSGVSNFWKDIPIIVVFTKSYSIIEIADNIKMLDDVMSQYKGKSGFNIKCALPVVAELYQLDDLRAVHPTGLNVLIDQTKQLADEAREINRKTLEDMEIARKHNLANAAVTSATAVAAGIGLVPVQGPDSVWLKSLQSGMLWSISKIYEIDDENAVKIIVDKILDTDIASKAGKQMSAILMAQQKGKDAAKVMNPIIAGTITFFAGQGCMIVFERIIRGELTPENTDWTKYLSLLFDEEILKREKMLKNGIALGDPEMIRMNLQKILSAVPWN